MYREREGERIKSRENKIERRMRVRVRVRETLGEGRRAREERIAEAKTCVGGGREWGGE
jgi:hypothetical protein